MENQEARREASEEEVMDFSRFKTIHVTESGKLLIDGRKPPKARPARPPARTAPPHATIFVRESIRPTGLDDLWICWIDECDVVMQTAKVDGLRPGLKLRTSIKTFRTPAEARRAYWRRRDLRRRMGYRERP